MVVSSTWKGCWADRRDAAAIVKSKGFMRLLKRATTTANAKTTADSSAALRNDNQKSKGNCNGES
jgi:hypothetical protein